MSLNIVLSPGCRVAGCCRVARVAGLPGCCRVFAGLPGAAGCRVCRVCCRVCCRVLPGAAGSAAGCCRVLPGAAGCCQAETMWGHFQVLPGAAGCCRVAGLPGCQFAGRLPGRAVGAPAGAVFRVSGG